MKNKEIKSNKLHELPGLSLTEPMVKPFKVVDNNGNWKIERPLFRWVRVDKSYAEDEAKLLNIGYQTAILDLLAKIPEALKNQKSLKEWKDKIEKQFKNVDFES